MHRPPLVAIPAGDKRVVPMAAVPEALLHPAVDGDLRIPPKLTTSLAVERA
jgi:hypothetical protein